MEISKQLKDEIWDYCRANDISNIDEFMIKVLKQGFTIEKYGSTPVPTIKENIVEKIVEVEKVVEVIKEVPINIVDMEMDKKIKNYIKLAELGEKKLRECSDLSDVLRKELELEKNKNKRDLYGE